MEPAYIAVIAIARILMDAALVAALAVVRRRGERRLRLAGEQLVAEAERYLKTLPATPSDIELTRNTRSS